MMFHPLKPIYNNKSKILILGSFPSIISRKDNFYYANKNNRFWKVMEIIFNVKLNNIESKIKFLLENKIALWDVIYSCEINNSSDASIKNVKPNNIKDLISKTKIKHIFINGKTALKYYDKYVKESIGIDAIYLPSTSSANARFKLEDLVIEYKNILFYL